MKGMGRDEKDGGTKKMGSKKRGGTKEMGERT
jgi:hypothetical protein